MIDDTALQKSRRFHLMTITVNGQPQEVEAHLTLANLLQQLDLKPDRVAVEVNLKIVDRPSFVNWNLQDGDQVEILSFIGGGAYPLINTHIREKP